MRAAEPCRISADRSFRNSDAVCSWSSQAYTINRLAVTAKFLIHPSGDEG